MSGQFFLAEHCKILFGLNTGFSNLKFYFFMRPRLVSEGSNTFSNISAQRPQNTKKKTVQTQINNTLKVDKIYFKLSCNLHAVRERTNFPYISYTEAVSYVVSNTKYNSRLFQNFRNKTL